MRRRRRRDLGYACYPEGGGGGGGPLGEVRHRVLSTVVQGLVEKSHDAYVSESHDKQLSETPCALSPVFVVHGHVLSAATCSLPSWYQFILGPGNASIWHCRITS